MRITTVNSGKGGSLKSTTAWALATWLNKNGYKALVIDFEPNANVSGFFDADYKSKPTMYHVFNEEVLIEEAVQYTKQGDIIAGNSTLGKIQALFSNDILNGIKALKNQMPKLKTLGYTHVIIDNQPLVGTMTTLQSATSAHDMIITLHPDPPTLQGLENLANGLTEAIQFNKELKIDGILLGRDKGTNNEKVYADKIREWLEPLNTKIYESIIREGISVQEAQGNVATIWDYAPNDNPTLDYLAFIKEYLNLEKEQNG